MFHALVVVSVVWSIELTYRDYFVSDPYGQLFCIVRHEKDPQVKAPRAQMSKLPVFKSFFFFSSSLFATSVSFHQFLSSGCDTFDLAVGSSHRTRVHPRARFTPFTPTKNFIRILSYARSSPTLSYLVPANRYTHSHRIDFRSGRAKIAYVCERLPIHLDFYRNFISQNRKLFSNIEISIPCVNTSHAQIQLFQPFSSTKENLFINKNILSTCPKNKNN